MGFIKDNKVLSIILGIFIIAIISVLVFVKVLSPNTGKSEYGNRLKGISKVEITKETQKKFISELEKKDKVDKADMNIKGRLINIIITVKDDTSKDDAKDLANSSLEFFEEEELEYYDYQVFLKNEKKEDGYLVIGYKHKTKENFKWSNN